MIKAELTKVFGITDEGHLVVIDPSSLVKIKEADAIAVQIHHEHWPGVMPRPERTIEGTIEEYVLIKDGAKIFEETMEEVVDKEIERLTMIKQTIKGD